MISSRHVERDSFFCGISFAEVCWLCLSMQTRASIHCGIYDIALDSTPGVLAVSRRYVVELILTEAFRPSRHCSARAAERCPLSLPKLLLDPSPWSALVAANLYWKSLVDRQARCCERAHPLGSSDGRVRSSTAKILLPRRMPVRYRSHEVELNGQEAVVEGYDVASARSKCLLLSVVSLPLFAVALIVLLHGTCFCHHGKICPAE